MSISTAHWSWVIVLYACASTSVLVCASNFTCPTWFFYNNATEQCECGKTFEDKLIRNGNTSVWIANGFCATMSVKDGLYYAGYCPFTHRQNSENRIFSELPSDPDMLDDVMCGPYNRKGLLCGECIDGHGPAVYARDMKCAKCNRGYIALYLVLELVPVTVFFVILVVFSLNITSGPLLGYVLFCQAFVLTIQANLDSFNYILDNSSSSYRVLLQCSVALAEVWNLQFLWSVIPAYCFSDTLTEIDLQMIGLVKPTFSIVLVIITYCLMRLYAAECRVLRILWKPFGFIFDKLWVTPVTSNIALHAFSSLLLLSAPTLAYNLYSLFDRVPVYNNIDGSVHTTVTHLSTHHTHALYAFISTAFLIAFLLAPSLLLCVYPTRMYRKATRVLSTKVQTAITVFVRAHNKCYKDGSDQSRDFRATAGLVLLLTSLIRPMGDLTIRESLGSQFITGAAFIFLSFAISYVRPCHRTIANFSLSYHSMLLGIFSIAGGLWRHDLNTGTNSLELTFIVPPFISHILILLWGVYLLIQHVAWLFGYRIDLGWPVRAVKRLCNRRRDGYQELINAP